MSKSMKIVEASRTDVGDMLFDMSHSLLGLLLFWLSLSSHVTVLTWLFVAVLDFGVAILTMNQNNPYKDNDDREFKKRLYKLPALATLESTVSWVPPLYS